MHYTHVDKPIRIGNIELKNRIVRPAHGTAYGKGIISDDMIAFHEARARGGVSLSILEIGSVHPTTAFSVNLYDAAIEPSYLKLMDRLRPYGMKVFQQLWHAGHHALPPDGSPPWSASDVPSVEVGVVPIPMTRAMIDEIVESYATCARRCESVGLDGVDIHLAHGYLPGQFLSPNTNKREDEYGGSFENRVRFTLELVAAVRSAVSRNFVVGARLAPDDTVNGFGVEDNLRLAQMMEQRGLIDYVSVSLGNYNSFPKMVGGMHEPMGYELPTSTPITRGVKLPTIVVGRFRTMEEADQVIRDGDADMVGLVRATIADPDLVRKSLAGQVDRVRPCIACLHSCVPNVTTPMGHMRCAVNPEVGSERFLGEDKLSPAAKPRKVLIVGGGPAGMEAARIAALRGHRVTLAEAAPHLGGMLRAAAMAPTRHGIMDYAVWLEAEIRRLGVDIRLNTYIESEDVSDVDAVIVATGSQPRMDGIHASHPGQPIRNFERPNVISSVDLFLSPPRKLGKTAVVIDDVGHYEGLAAAEHLVKLGLSVNYVTRQRAFAPLVQMSLTNEPFEQRMQDKDFHYAIRTRALAIEDGAVVVGPVALTSDANQRRIPADTVVFVSHNRPNRELYEQLRERGLDVKVIGDANSPRYLETAVREGYLAGMAA
ncbi:MAG: FAD-dependent oxidoreductase [Georgfuchsia sp.]